LISPSGRDPLLIRWSGVKDVDWLLRGLKRFRSARVISAGHAFLQNLGRGHYELGVDIDRGHRLTAAFGELARAI